MHRGNPVHTPSDGRGPRHVYVNGKKVERCILADTRRGFAVYNEFPFRIVGKDELATKRIKGRVRVEAILPP